MRLRRLLVLINNMTTIEELSILLANETLDRLEMLALNPVRRFAIPTDCFEMSDRTFIRSFRLTKQLVRELINIITPYLIHPSRSSALGVERKVFAALNFFATGSYQFPVGSNVNLNMSQSSVSRAISEVTCALNTPEVMNQWVKFPSSVQELQAVRNRFYNEFNFPGIVGCIDCTHVAIVPPRSNDPDYPENIYVNRKHYHSINVQLICDSQLEVMHVNARFPRSTHDSHVWNCSSVEPALRNLYRNGHEGYYLIGDSGYPLRPWLLTPISHYAPNSPEERFNNVFKAIRSTIERCNGVLKMRFRCLLKHRVLHYKPEKASKIINACVVLHNMCIRNNVPEPEYDEGSQNLTSDDFLDYGEESNNNDGGYRGRNLDLIAGNRLCNYIVQNYFNVIRN